MKKHSLLVLLICIKSGFLFSQVLSDEESKLYKLLMEYRKEKGLPLIPVSKSLTIVAQTHVRDLQENFTRESGCNMHSWSNKGKWTACCYTPDHAQAECMWRKPQELTTYAGNGYEIAHGGQNYIATAEKAISGWKNSVGHNAVMINEGIWKDKWNAVGIGIYGGYAVVWFGIEFEN